MSALQSRLSALVVSATATISQREFSKRSGVSQQAISDLVHGLRPNLRADTAVRILRALGVPPARAGVILYECCPPATPEII